MLGYRKLALGFVYMAGVIAIGVIIAMRSPEHLGGAGEFALGMATGLGTIVWGNSQEHKANASVQMLKAQVAPPTQ